MARRLTTNQEIAGSIPASVTSFLDFLLLRLRKSLEHVVAIAFLLGRYLTMLSFFFPSLSYTTVPGKQSKIARRR